MREFATKLYKSKQWQETRSAYLSSVGGLCENCLAKGIYRPAEIVHHKEFVQPWNITNPEVTLAWSNLKAVCRKCHALEHDEIYERPKKKKKRRFEVDENGNVHAIFDD